MATPQPSKTQINKAGDYLAQAVSMTPAEYVAWFDYKRHREATKIVSDYRAAHARPLGNISQGLRQIVKSETGEPPIVSQRLKRVPRILRKLSRMGHGGLARLEDIGGCRAVLPNAETLERVREHVEGTWSGIVTQRRRHVDIPTPMGYRAHHLTVMKFGRTVEVQLRTQGQQDWADSVESIDSRRGLTLKDGVGPDSLTEYFAGAGDMIYSLEYGVPLSDEARRSFEAARERVIEERYFRRRRD